MGPNLLIDKSAIQGLSVGEIRYLHFHYSLLHSPILFQEIAANLEKHPDDPDLSKEKVSLLAYKIHGLGFRLPHYMEMVYANLHGAEIPTNGQIPVFDGFVSKMENGGSALLIDQSPEELLIAHWSSGQFKREDFELARRINSRPKLDLKLLQQTLQFFAGKKRRFQSMNALVEWLDTDFFPTGSQWIHLERFLISLGWKDRRRKDYQTSWFRRGARSFREHAPYAYFCYRLLFIFLGGVANELIPVTERAKAGIDLEYLFYLPITMVFSSRDKFHRLLVPFLLRENQDFIWGDDLKVDLNTMMAYAEATKASTGSYPNATYPPRIDGLITGIMWDRHMAPRWREYAEEEGE